MDATVDQLDGYRFVYLLPTGPNEIFVEDTYYSDSPDLNVALIRNRIAAMRWRKIGVSQRWCMRKQACYPSSTAAISIVSGRRMTGSPAPASAPGCSIP
jgi:hypothetical protein